MFQNGNAEAAIRRYAEVFDHFTIDELDRCPLGAQPRLTTSANTTLTDFGPGSWRTSSSLD